MKNRESYFLQSCPRFKLVAGILEKYLQDPTKKFQGTGPTLAYYTAQTYREGWGLFHAALVAKIE